MRLCRACALDRPGGEGLAARLITVLLAEFICEVMNSTVDEHVTRLTIACLCGSVNFALDIFLRLQVADLG